MSFEPKILGLLCNWCSYSAADLAGASKLAYPPNLRVVRVMCTGRIDPTFVAHAFARGADGVLICGCHPGDCHYVNGNLKAAARIDLLQRMLAPFGVDPGRLRIEWISAQEAERFAALVADFTETIRALGPITGQVAERIAATPAPVAEEPTP